ncbi:3-keto-5-aminohexanoate cleavage enzyme [compost metagenome]
MPIAAISASIGGNVRVGLEDSLWESPGQLATSSAAQVKRVRTIIEALSLEVATPEEARQMLQLKGRNSVAF